MAEVYMEVPMERFIEYKRAEENNVRLREALDNAAGYISIGESAKANDIICRALGIDINHYGIYGEEEAE